MASLSFLTRLDNAIRENALYSHPFYQAWSKGTLSLSDLQVYAKQYYHFEKAFPTFVSGVHSNTEDPETRHQLLLNLIEEEHGENNHPELWLRFAESLGIDREDVRNATLHDSTKHLIATFRKLTREGNTIQGLAALYGYESQIPENSRSKIEGLIRHYGITSDDGLSFFRVHEEADEIHSRAEREHLAGLIRTEQDEEQAIESARTAAKAIYEMLSGIEAACKQHRKDAALQS
ncbi:MAG TPA: CADD family putative folate metabolism protein [Candidatus Kapabacteria bacterium]|jgi:pyrroloquinoline-quinone synthase|nr:CADD family putative folate metabolism protein [Candidatus Kapabacteria bacterium]